MDNEKNILAQNKKINLGQMARFLGKDGTKVSVSQTFNNKQTVLKITENAEKKLQNSQEQVN